MPQPCPQCQVPAQVPVSQSVKDIGTPCPFLTFGLASFYFCVGRSKVLNTGHFFLRVDTWSRGLMRATLRHSREPCDPDIPRFNGWISPCLTVCCVWGDQGALMQVLMKCVVDATRAVLARSDSQDLSLCRSVICVGQVQQVRRALQGRAIRQCVWPSLDMTDPSIRTSNTNPPNPRQRHR